MCDAVGTSAKNEREYYGKGATVDDGLEKLEDKTAASIWECWVYIHRPAKFRVTSTLLDKVDHKVEFVHDSIPVRAVFLSPV